MVLEFLGDKIWLRVVDPDVPGVFLGLDILSGGWRGCGPGERKALRRDSSRGRTTGLRGAVRPGSPQSYPGLRDNFPGGGGGAHCVLGGTGGSLEGAGGSLRGSDGGLRGSGGGGGGDGASGS